AQGAPRGPQRREPRLEDLGTIGEKAIGGHVLDAGRVPEEPGDGVDAGMGTPAKLGLGHGPKQACHQAVMEIAVAREEEGDGVHGRSAAPPYWLIHTFMKVLL